jgi:hypothetical protein
MTDLQLILLVFAVTAVYAAAAYGLIRVYRRYVPYVDPALVPLPPPPSARVGTDVVGIVFGLLFSAGFCAAIAVWLDYTLGGAVLLFLVALCLAPFYDAEDCRCRW